MAKEKLKKSGFAVLVGRSNVGKSTLLNALVGSKIAITTPIPATTRMPIHGVFTDDRGQVVFVDTPGVFEKTKDAVTKKMVQTAKDSLDDIDVILYVVDHTRQMGNEEQMVQRLISEAKQPTILVINKIDRRGGDNLDYYRDMAKDYDGFIEISALKGKNIIGLRDMIYEYLPDGEPYYPEMQITNMENKLWLSELIREKVFLRMRQEVPYSVYVEVDEVETREDGMVYIKARIITSERRYKQMLIGKGGRGIKEIGQAARKELEGVMNTKIFLDMEVEVNEHWMEAY